MKALFLICHLVLVWSLNIKTLHSKTWTKLCYEKHGDFLAHPQDCTKFIRCSHNRAYEFQCADNLLWHHDIKACDYSQNVECTRKSKFKREIKNNSYRQDNTDKFAANTKRQQSLLSALPTSPKFTEIYVTSTYSTSMLTKKLLKLTKDHTTPCTKQTDLIKNHTETLKATGNSVNVTTNYVKLTTNPINLTTIAELTTAPQELKETTNLSVNLTKNLVNLTAENFINLSTQRLESTSQLELKTDHETLTEAETKSLELTTLQVELLEMTNLSVSFTKDLVNLTTDKLVSTSPPELPTDQATLTEAETSSLELTTPQVELKKSTNLSVNLTKNVVNLTATTTEALATETTFFSETENFVNLNETNLPTNQMESSSPAELTTEKSHSEIETTYFPNETTDNLVNLTKENLIKLPKRSDITDQEIKATTIDISNSIADSELPTYQADMLENTTENIGNLLTEPAIKTDHEESLEMTNTLINLKENIVYLPTSEPALKTEPLESTSFVELTTEFPTDQVDMLETTTENIGILSTSETVTKTEHLESTIFIEFSTELPTDQSTLLETTTENIGNLATSEPAIKTEYVESTSFMELTTELPTDHGELIETTNTLIILKENFGNLATIEPEIETEPLESTSFMELTTELPTDRADMLETTTKNIENLPTSEPTIKTELLESTKFVKLTTELPTDHGELLETTNALISLTENLGNLTTSQPVLETESLASISFIELTTELPTAHGELVETTNTIINLNENLTTSKPAIETEFLKSTSFVDLTTELPTDHGELIETTNPPINLKENIGNLATSKSQDSKTTTEYYVKSEITDGSMAIESISTGSETVTELSEPTKYADDLIFSTIIPIKSSLPSDEFKAIDSDITPATTDLFLAASTTIDPRLPFRSPACQGNNNRRQFMAAKCYQYYQCFAGWAFLLNCHDGWLFQTDIAACSQDVNNEC